MQRAVPTGIITTNRTPFPIGVTIYNALGAKTDTGCVGAKTSRIWLAGKYRPGEVITVQGDIKQAASDCSGSTCYTTRLRQIIGDFSMFTFQMEQAEHLIAQELGDTNVTITSSCADYTIWVDCMGLGKVF